MATRRTAKQIAATKKLVALNKKRAKAKKGGAKKRATKGAKKGARKAKTRSTAKKVASRGTSAGKIKKGSSLAKVIEKVNRMETRVDLHDRSIKTLEHNDAANYGMWMGAINSTRKARGNKTLNSLPGFVKPRLYSPGKTRAIGPGI